MNITKELVKKIADQSRLHLKDEEIEKLIPQMKEILEAFSQLDKLDTTETKPSFHPVEIKNVTREDKTSESLTQEEALSLTEHKRDGYFEGPKAI